MISFPILSVILLTPLVAGAIIAVLPKRFHETMRQVAALAMIIVLLLVLFLYVDYDTAAGGMQYTEYIPWIADLGVAYSLGIDGISLPLLLLSSAVGLASVFSSWHIEHRTKEYFVLLLILIAGVSGAFLARDLFLFLLLTEMVVVPAYIMVLIWGSSERIPKSEAAMKMTIFLLVGSAFMLVGVILLYVYAFPDGARTFDVTALSMSSVSGNIPYGVQVIAFLLLLVGFGSHLSMFPFHIWSPDGYSAAPTAVSMINAGVLKKIGGYALIRIGFFILPFGAKFWAPVIALLATINVVYASYVALAQKDIKYMISYSSVSHMGYVLLGLAALNVVSVTGAVAYMVAHGIMIALFFSQVGYVYDKTDARSTDDLWGLAHYMPYITTGFMLAGLCALGLPGLIGFIPEFTIFVGSFSQFPVLTVISVFGIIFTAFYVLRMLAKVLFGKRIEKFEGIKDERHADVVPLAVLGVFLVGFGVFPSLLMDTINSGVAPLSPLFDLVKDAPMISLFQGVDIWGGIPK